jgi:hypothetical protein
MDDINALQKRIRFMKSIKRLQTIIGNPDYAVIAMYWPWPDGGYMAGCSLIDPSWAEEQNLPGYKKMREDKTPEWNCFDGFENGINFYGSTIEEAIDKLWNNLVSGE